MSLNEITIRQRDFSAGEVDPDAVRRDDTDVLARAVKRGLNLVSRHTGGLAQRPGRRMLFQDDGVIGEFKPFDDVTYRVVFVAGAVRIRTTEGALVASLAAPWNANDLDNLVWEPDDNEIIVCWRGRTRVITVAPGTGVWSIAFYSFKTGIDGAVRVPFFRFSATAGITMKPSARTGTVTVTFSANVLSSSHVGSIFRYADRQLRITAVTNAKTATAVVLEKLTPTFDITVASTDGFSIGQTVETDTTNVKMEIIGTTATVLNCISLGNLTTPVNSEKIVGPNASATISGVTEVAPGATVQWDEQFISDYRGWPRSVSKDRQRLIFTNFASLKNAVCWSAVGDNRDFMVGADPDDAIFETIDAECQVFHIVGGYDEFAITDKGAYYIPVSVGTPLQPGSVEFRLIYASEIANIRPIQVTEGVIFVDKAMTGLYAINATGQTARPYIATEANRLHRHLFSGVKSIAVSSGTSVFPSRQIYAVNADGTVAVGQFNPDSEYIGWLPWDGAGEVRSVTGNYGSVVMMTRYLIDGVMTGVAEELDYSLLFDCATVFDGADVTDFLELNNGSPLELNNGDELTLEGYVTQFYAGQEVSIYAGGFYFGEIVVPDTGVITGFAEYGEVTAGIRFDWELVPLFINFDGGQPAGQAEKRRKVANMLITVRDTQEFQCGSRIFGSYRGGEDMSLPVPERDETYRYRETGRSYDPEVPLKSTFPCKFKLIELTTRLTV